MQKIKIYHKLDAGAQAYEKQEDVFAGVISQNQTQISYLLFSKGILTSLLSLITLKSLPDAF